MALSSFDYLSFTYRLVRVEHYRSRVEDVETKIIRGYSLLIENRSIF